MESAIQVLEDRVEKAIQYSPYVKMLHPHLNRFRADVVPYLSNGEEVKEIYRALAMIGSAVRSPRSEWVDHDPLGDFLRYAMVVRLSVDLLPRYLVWLHAFVLDLDRISSPYDNE